MPKKAQTPNSSSSTTRELWNERDIKDFCREIRANGKHWAFIPSILHDAIVAEQVVRVVTASSLSRENPIGARDVVDLNRRIKEMLLPGDEG